MESEQSHHAEEVVEIKGSAEVILSWWCLSAAASFLSCAMMCSQFGIYRDKAVALEEIVVSVSTMPGVVHKITIPEGYSFDGASIPRLLWPIFGHPFSGDLILAACVHDWYCDRSHSHSYFDRVIGDAVLYRLLHQAGVVRWRRMSIYVGVRLFAFLFVRRSGE